MLHKINFIEVNTLRFSIRIQPKTCVLIYFWRFPWFTDFKFSLHSILFDAVWILMYWWFLKIVIHQFFVNTNERTIQLWADIADPLARYYLMRYHFQIKLNTNEDDGGWPRGRCRSWRRSTGTAPSSSGWGRPDSRARGGSPSARGASRWFSRWAAPARTASRSRGGTGPDKSGGESQLWKPETGDYKHVYDSMTVREKYEEKTKKNE